MDAADALLDLRRVPRLVDVHDDARALEVEPDAARVRREEHAALRVALEALDERGATSDRDAPREADVADPELVQDAHDEVLAVLPLREDDGLLTALDHELVEDPGQLVELGGAPLLPPRLGVVVEDERVADPPRVRHVRHEVLALDVGQEAAPHELLEQDRGRLPLLVVGLSLVRRERHRVEVVDPLGEVGEHLLLPAPQHDGRGARAELVEVLPAGDLAVPVEAEVALVELIERPEEALVHELDDRVEVVEAVLERSAREHEREPAREALRRLRRLGAPVLEPLRLVEDEHVRGERGDRIFIAERDLVVRDREGGLPLVEGAPLRTGPLDDRRGLARGARDLARPLRLERSRADDEDAARLARLAEVLGRGDRLERLSEAHVVGEDRAARRREEDPALDLVGVELEPHGLPLLAARLDGLEESRTTLGAPVAIGELESESPGVVADPELAARPAERLLERGERRARAPAQSAAAVEEPLDDRPE